MATTDHTIDGTAEEIGTDLVPAPPPPALFKTEDPVEVIEKATAVANALKGVLDGKHLTSRISDKDYVRVEGWQTLGAMLGVTAVCVATDVVDGGFKATVEARMPDGRVVGRADAVCTKYEKRGPWKTADDYARLSMAQTRATSKALKGPLGFVVSLAGYETTPAEEMAGVGRAEPEVAAEPSQNGNGDRPLGPAAVAKVVKAIEDAGQPVELFLAACNIESTDDLTRADAEKIRAMLDRLAAS